MTTARVKTANLQSSAEVSLSGDRISISGLDAPFRVCRNRKARRMLLRVDHTSGTVVLTLPRGAGLPEGLRFIGQHAAWVISGLEAVPPAQPFADGGDVPLRGVPHRIRHHPGARGTAWIEDGEIHVAGRPEHLKRRLREFLIRLAKEDFAELTNAMAPRTGRAPAKVAIRDAKSRWGSCTAGGNLTFSWRMILAPRHVTHYLVAHEMAHLQHMNHGPAFWALVHELAPGMDAARLWLRQNGAMLHRLGADLN